MRRDPLRHAPLFIALLSCTGLRAHEGMWLPTLLQAKRYYDSDRHAEGVGLRNFPLHPRQPLALPPVFSPGLLVGKRNAAAREAIVLKQAA